MSDSIQWSSLPTNRHRQRRRPGKTAFRVYSSFAPRQTRRSQLTAEPAGRPALWPTGASARSPWSVPAPLFRPAPTRPPCPRASLDLRRPRGPRTRRGRTVSTAATSAWQTWHAGSSRSMVSYIVPILVQHCLLLSACLQRSADCFSICHAVPCSVTSLQKKQMINRDGTFLSSDATAGWVPLFRLIKAHSLERCGKNQLRRQPHARRSMGDE